MGCLKQEWHPSCTEKPSANLIFEVVAVIAVFKISH